MDEVMEFFSVEAPGTSASESGLVLIVFDAIRQLCKGHDAVVVRFVWIKTYMTRIFWRRIQPKKIFKVRYSDRIIRWCHSAPQWINVGRSTAHWIGTHGSLPSWLNRFKQSPLTRISPTAFLMERCK